MKNHPLATCQGLDLWTSETIKIQLISSFQSESKESTKRGDCVCFVQQLSELKTWFQHIWHSMPYCCHHHCRNPEVNFCCCFCAIISIYFCKSASIIIRNDVDSFGRAFYLNLHISYKNKYFSLSNFRFNFLLPFSKCHRQCRFDEPMPMICRVISSNENIVWSLEGNVSQKCYILGSSKPLQTFCWFFLVFFPLFILHFFFHWIPNHKTILAPISIDYRAVTHSIWVHQKCINVN